MTVYFLTIGIFTIIFILISHYNITLPIAYTLFLALFTRLFVTLLFSHSLSSDIYSFLTTGHVLLQRIPIFPSVYFPFIFYLGAFSLLLGKYIAPLLFLKIVFSLFDVGVTYLIYKISKNPHSALLYAFHPAMLVIITIHGQLDALPLFFLLLSIYAFQNKRIILPAVLLGIAIAIKPWPLIFVPIFLKKARNLLSYIFVIIIPGVTVLLHAFFTQVAIQDIITPIKNYRGIYGIWGIGSIMYTLFPVFWDQYIQAFRRVFLLSFAFWQFLDHRKHFLQELFLSLLVFFVFSPLFGVQWMSWIIPFMVIFDHKPIIRTVFVSVYVALAFLSDITPQPVWYGPVRDMTVQSIGLIVWLSICFLLLSYRRLLLNSSLKNSMSFKQ